MSLLTMTDCSDAGNRVQARYELDRAESITSQSVWAMKWGLPLLEYADQAPSEDEVSDDLKQAEAEAADAEARADELADEIEAAITALDKIEASEEIRDAIDDVVASLENAL